MFLLLQIIIYLFLFSFPSYSANLFSVTGVKVKVTAQNSVIAKRQGYVRAQKLALQRLYLRIVPYGYIKQIPTIDHSTFNNFIKSFSVDNEVATKVTYRAEFSIDFNRSQITEFLRYHKIPHTTEKGGSSIIIPIYVEDGRSASVLGENIWLSAWNALIADSAHISLQLPSPSDKIFTNSLVRDLIVGEERAIKAVEKYYNNQYVVIAVFSNPSSSIYENDLPQIYHTSLKGYIPAGDIDLKRNYRSGELVENLAQKVARIYLKTMEYRWQQYNIAKQKKNNYKKLDSANSISTTPYNSKEGEFSGKVFNQPQQPNIGIDNQNNYRYLREYKISFLASFKDYRNWVDIRDTLLRIFGDNKITLRAITSKNAYVELKTSLQREEIYNRVRRSGLKIRNKGDYVSIYRGKRL